MQSQRTYARLHPDTIELLGCQQIAMVLRDHGSWRVFQVEMFVIFDEVLIFDKKCTHFSLARIQPAVSFRGSLGQS